MVEKGLCEQLEEKVIKLNKVLLPRQVGYRWRGKPFNRPSVVLAKKEESSQRVDEIKKDKTAWNNYIKFSEPYKRIRIAYIDSARKRPEEFAKRLTNFIQKTRDNKLISGFGGIDKYY